MNNFEDKPQFKNEKISNKDYNILKEELVHQAIKFHLKGDIKEAEKYYKYFLNQGYKDHRVFSNYGTILKNNGRLKEAELHTRKAIELEPNYANAYSNLGMILKGLGKLKDAEKSVRKAIKINPKFANAYFNLGIIQKELGKSKEAEFSTLRAIELKPKFPEAYSSLGTIFIDLGKLQEAELSTRKAIELKPDYADAYCNLGQILKDLGKLKEAEIKQRKAIELKPDFAIAHSNLGTILKNLGRLKEAEISQRKAVNLQPNLAHTHYNLANTLKELGKLQEAELSTRKAIEIKPNFPEAYSNLGTIFIDLGKLQEAEIYTKKAIELKPNYAIAYSNLGCILNDLGDLQEAELSFRKAIELKPDFADSYSNLGSILLAYGKLKEAESSARKAIELKPNFPDAYSNLGYIFRDLGKYDDAICSFKKAIKLNDSLSSVKAALVGSRRDICDWNDQETENTWIETLGIKGESVIPFNFLFFEDNPLNHLKRSQKLYKEKFTQRINPIDSFKNKKIHVGYFSSDFKEHATMYLIASILELHDKSKFKIYLYSFTSEEDKYTERAKNSGCIFRDIKKLSTIETVELARNDRLDIAIDLKGYTQHCRMNIFSNRVAPIQINYLGYPGSLGAETIDYIIADNIIIPKENEKFYSEKIIRMPNCYQCNDDKKIISQERISRKDFKLPEKGFVFTCFNANRKISTKEFNIWMRLLIEIEGSVLWLYKSNKWAVKNLCLEAEKRNVNSNRLIFANKLPLDQHLARHVLGDLGLDTFNYNGHTTTSDALWAGLPVLTKIGSNFAARVSASLLTSAGMTELITYNEKEYEEKALYIARNQNELIKLKSKLAKSKKTSTLFNSKLYTKDLENKFKKLVD